MGVKRNTRTTRHHAAAPLPEEGMTQGPVTPPPDQGCNRPSEGWYCSRKPGHEGPCAAREVGLTLGQDWVSRVTALDAPDMYTPSVNALTERELQLTSLAVMDALDANASFGEGDPTELERVLKKLQHIPSATPPVEGVAASPPTTQDREAMDESPTDRFERLAEKFFRETGIMAPGKDVPMGMGQPEYGIRWAAYMNWLAKEHPDV